MQQRLRFRSIKVIERDHSHAGIDPFLDGLALKTLDHGTHAQVTHIERILDHDSVQLFRANRIDERLTRVKTYEHYLSCFADVLKREQHSRAGRFGRTKDAWHLGSEATHQTFG